VLAGEAIQATVDSGGSIPRVAIAWGSDGSNDMAAKDTSGQPKPGQRAGEAGDRPGQPSDDVAAILDDMDEALEDNPEEIIRSYVQEGGQ
jgi:ubiquitin-like protein Pup